MNNNSEEDTGRAGQSSSPSRPPDSNVDREPVVDNSDGPSQSTTNEQPRPDNNTNNTGPVHLDPTIIEISDEETNGPSRAANAAPTPAEKRRKIGGEMTVYRVKFKFIGESTTPNEQGNVRPNNEEENTGQADQSASPAQIPNPNVICESLIPKLMDKNQKPPCRVIRKPTTNTTNPRPNQQLDSTIIEISDEENSSSSGPSTQAPLNPPRPVEKKRKRSDMTMYSYKLKLNLVRENSLIFTDQNTFRMNSNNEEQEEENSEAAQGSSPRTVPNQNVISESVINKLIDSCEGLSQSTTKSKPQPDNENSEGNSQAPEMDNNIIEISDDESNTSSGPSAVATANIPLPLEKRIKQEKEDDVQDEDDQA